MLAQTVTCPHCKITLTTNEMPSVGVSVTKCPGCGKSVPLAPKAEPEPTHVSASSQLQAVPDVGAGAAHGVRQPGDSGDESRAISHGPAAPAKFGFLSPPQQADELGRLGPYRILGVSGSGGMGVVFRAEDPVLRRQIALKVMLPQYAIDPASRARFLREARVQAAIEHDHIIDIYQVGEEREVPYIAMPLLKGRTLADALKANPSVPISEAIRIAREVAEGLSAAHEENLVHRDIKPANIWLESRRRRVKILDFGLARGQVEVEGTEQVTGQGSIVGTPSHMSPEQARGESVDARTDLFSLGVVLYQMLTARQPFAGHCLPATILAVISHTPPRPAELNPLVPRELDALTMRLLAKEAADRPASASAVVEALRAIEVDLNLTATIPQVAHRASADPWIAITKTDPDSELPPANQAVGSPEVPERAAKPQARRPWALGASMLALVAASTFAAGIFLKTNGQDGSGTVSEGVTDTFARRNPDPEPKPPDETRVILPQDAKKEAKVEPEPKKESEPKKDPEPKREPEPKRDLELAPPPKLLFDHRDAAEWVLGIGGVVRVNDLGNDIKLVADLPRERFRLTSVWLRNTKASDAGLANLKDCHTLVYLNLSNTQVTDAGLIHFKDCKNLAALNLGGTQVTDVGLAHFTDRKALTAINLANTQVTDAGLAQFKECKNLMYLNLSNTQVTDAGLIHFKECKGLTSLWLSRTQVSNAGLDHFKDCKSLSVLHVLNTKVPVAKIDELKKSLPHCKIEWDGGIIEPK